MAISTAESKFKYFTVVNKRETAYCSPYQSYSALQNEINSYVGVGELAMGNITFQTRLQNSLSSCTSVCILSNVVNTNGMLIPFDKSVDMYDCSLLSQAETMYIDFSGGKNSLGIVSNPPTNI